MANKDYYCIFLKSGRSWFLHRTVASYDTIRYDRRD